MEQPATGVLPRRALVVAGGAVEDAELRREIALFRDAGFGGVEIQPFLLGFTPDELESDPDIRTVGTEEFFRKVGVAAAEADKNDMALDFTLGSGWSSGVFLKLKRATTNPTKPRANMTVPRTKTGVPIFKGVKITNGNQTRAISFPMRIRTLCILLQSERS